MDDALTTYEIVDRFFGAPYVDVDEERTVPVPHRYLHGGFVDTATRFSFSFPNHYERRFFHYLQGGYGGDENATATGRDFFGGLAYAASRGGFFIESNQGHIGAEPCPKGGSDATVYAYRASAECARLARHLAAAHYGVAPTHGYVFGGSGGGFRTLCCTEFCDDGVWDAGVASVIGSSGTLSGYSAMNNARRALGERFAQVVDSVEPGGSGDPFAHLTVSQREALADLYASGFPRGAERSVPEGLNAGVFLWTWNADALVTQQRDYFTAFWSEPGHAGADGQVDDALIDLEATVARTVTAEEAVERAVLGFGSMLLAAAPDKSVGIVLSGDALDGAEGARITITSGAAAGRQLYCVAAAEGLLLGSAIGEAQTRLFDGVEPGDGIHVDNRDFLAYCSYYRHHLASPDDVRRLSMDGHPIYPQHEVVGATSLGSAVFGPMELTGAIRRPIFLLQHTHDTSGWPAGGVEYADRVRAHLTDRIDAQFRFWWLDQAEHIPASSIPVRSRPAPTTRLIDYEGAHEAALDAMVAWIERGVEPPEPTSYTFDPLDHGLHLANGADERGGIQPVAALTANGHDRADVHVGDSVQFAVIADAPSGGGAIVEFAWDYDGSGTWPVIDVLVEPAPIAKAETRYVFGEAGTYFPAVRVVTHPTGDGTDRYARVMNLARCRVVVT